MDVFGGRGKCNWWIPKVDALQAIYFICRCLPDSASQFMRGRLVLEALQENSKQLLQSFCNDSDSTAGTKEWCTNHSYSLWPFLFLSCLAQLSLSSTSETESCYQPYIVVVCTWSETIVVAIKEAWVLKTINKHDHLRLSACTVVVAAGEWKSFFVKQLTWRIRHHWSSCNVAKVPTKSGQQLAEPRLWDFP